jgi:hypothetical protein
MPKEMQKSRSGWEEFARVAMATTSLSLTVGGMAAASTITEGTPPAPADFPNVTPGFLLPVGTTTVFGSVNKTLDAEDWFEFQGLQPGQAFSLHGNDIPLNSEQGTTVFVFNSSNTPIGKGFEIGEGSGTMASGTIPGDGKLIVEVVRDSETGNGTFNYEIDLTAPLAPPAAPTSVPAASPLSLSVLGLGLALTGGLAWRSKRGAEG